MIAALLLASYAVLAGSQGARVLLRAGWPARAPRSGIVAWQALTASVVLAVLLTGLSLALPYLPLRFELAHLLGADSAAVAEHYGTPHGAGPVTAGLVAVAVAFAVLAGTALRGARARTRTRRDQRAVLRMVGRAHPEGFTVVDHERPLVYCLPGRPRAVVLSTGALALLDTRERRLVLGHERRHLAARDHLTLAWSETLARAFGWVPLFAAAHRQTAVLVEMAADDTASTSADRLALARALLALGAGGRPAATLGATDTAAVQRVRRLTDPTPRRRGQALVVAAAASLVLSAPVVLALSPGIEATTHAPAVHP